jgi:predicted  nucleic acid-binding Zn-ribbon protein
MEKCEDCGCKEFTVYNEEKAILACAECGQFNEIAKPLIAEKDAVAKLQLQRGVMKQLFEEEVDRLNETRSILVGQGNHETAQKIYQQMIGVQTFWKILRNKSIAS